MSDGEKDGLRVLTRRPAETSGWLAPDVVRSVAVRRRRRGYGIGAAVVVAALVAVLVPTLTSGSGSRPRPPLRPAVAARGLHVAGRVDGAQELIAPVRATSVASAPDVTKVAGADAAFAVKLLQQLFPSDGSNVSVSPASLSLALAMLQNGAAGETQSQILSAMQAGDLTRAELDAGWAGLAKEWSAAAKDGGLTFTSANSVWAQSGMTPGAQFMAALARYFDTGEWQVDFARDPGGAVRAINDWVAAHTDGRITQLFQHLDPQTLLVLANAVYFNATWQYRFDPNNTKPGTFTLADGSTEQVRFMNVHQTAALDVARAPGYEAVQMPYQGRRFAALAIMPTDRSLATFVQALSIAKLDAVLRSLHVGLADVSIPKFVTRSTLDTLPTTLASLGMRDAFGEGADFAPMRIGDAVVNRVVQKVYLRVAEKGTVAAAATGVTMIPASTSAATLTTIHLDHPFLFLVRDTTTGAILFASAIQNPKG